MFRVLLLVVAPTVFFVALASTLVSALQAATTIQDSSLKFGVRLLAFALVMYFLAPLFASHVVAFAQHVYGP